MTVKELIVKLQECSPESEIILIDYFDDEYEIKSISDFKTQIHIHIDDYEPKVKI